MSEKEKELMKPVALFIIVLIKMATLRMKNSLERCRDELVIYIVKFIFINNVCRHEILFI